MTTGNNMLDAILSIAGIMLISAGFLYATRGIDVRQKERILRARERAEARARMWRAALIQRATMKTDELGQAQKH